MSAFACVLTAHGASAQDLDRFGLPLLVTTPTPPIPVRADGAFRLVYELHLTNAGSKPVTLKRVEVWSTAKLAAMEGDDLTKAIEPTALDTKEPQTIGSGAHAVLMMWVSLDRAPDTIMHRLEGVEGGDEHPLLLQSPAVPIRGEPVLLAPPLRGDRWLAANGRLTIRTTAAAGSRTAAGHSFRNGSRSISYGCTRTARRTVIRLRMRVGAGMVPKPLPLPRRALLRSTTAYPTTSQRIGLLPV